MTRLEPSFREKVWGVTHLGPWFEDRPAKTGEVWFEHTPPLPILFKFLFTSENLSVQVHPPDRGAEPGKTEMWYVLRAEPGAKIALGFRQRYSAERVRAAAESGDLVDMLEWIPVRAGETYFTPARTVHAIGAGLALCEIQQNSDVTYRLFDYGRPRELHLDASLEVARLEPHDGLAVPVDLGEGRQLLAECPYFRTELIETAEPLRIPAGAGTELYTLIEGEGCFASADFHPGEVWLAEGEQVQIVPQTRVRLLRCFVP